MGSFKRALFGYRRPEVDAAISARDGRIESLEQLSASLDRQVVKFGRQAIEASQQAAEIDRQAAEIEWQVETIAELELETVSLSAMVIERERDIRGLSERLREADERQARSIASLDAISARLEEIQAQARGQATRIRMKALREAVEVSRRVQALTDAQQPAAADGIGMNGAAGAEPAYGIFEGEVKLEIGPLGDFSQLVGFEDAVGQLGASEISVERFSEGRATLSMHLDEPTELLRELEELSSLDFKVRHTAPDNLILDVDEDQGSGQQAA